MKNKITNIVITIVVMLMLFSSVSCTKKTTAKESQTVSTTKSTQHTGITGVKNLVEKSTGFNDDAKKAKSDTISSKNTTHTTTQTEKQTIEIQNIFHNVSVPEGSNSQPVVVFDVYSVKQYNILIGSAKKPPVAIVYLNADLDVCDINNKKITSLQAVLDILGNKTVPAFYIKDKTTVDNLINLILTHDYNDCIVVSNNAEHVKKVRTYCPMVYAMIDYSKTKIGSKHDRLMLRNTTNKNLANIALLPASATYEDIVYLQKRMISVWIKSDDTDLATYCALLSGADGVITKNHEKTFEKLKLFESNTKFKEIFLVAHRGQPETHQENTLSGAKASLESGADHIELDIYLTINKKLAVFHDMDLDWITDGKGQIENYTSEQLKSFKINSNSLVEKGTIPMLDEYFSYFNDKDILLNIDIKSNESEAISILKLLIDEYGMSAKVNLLCNSVEQLKLCRMQMPEISCVFLYRYDIFDNKIESVVKDIATITQYYNAKLSPDFNLINNNVEHLVFALNCRGVIVWPWTYYTIEDLNIAYNQGWKALTTGCINYCTDMIERVVSFTHEINIETNQLWYCQATSITKTGAKLIECEPIIIKGDISFKKQNLGYVSEKAGEAWILLKYTAEQQNTTIYSEPIKINIS